MGSVGGQDIFNPRKPLSFLPAVFPPLLLPGILNAGKPPKIPDPMAPPIGTPPPTPTDRNPQLTAQQRAKKLASLRYGIASTMRNDPTMAPANLATPALQPLKTKTGA